MGSSERVSWIDTAKGICILAVVSMYAVERVGDAPGSLNWMEAWVRFARPFRMPDFFLISGLFLARVIDRPWRDYLDKKAVHYLYFFALWSLIYFPLLLVQGKEGVAPAALFLKMFYEPFGMLWFLQMLAVYFVLARLLKDAPVQIVFPLALLWQMFPVETSWHQFDRIGERFVYFYAGYAFAPRFFRLADRAARRPRAALVWLGAWAALNGALVFAGVADRPGVGACLGFLGAAAVIAVSSLLSRRPAMAWLSRLGERSIVIYLSFLIPMTALLLGVEKLGWRPDGALLAVGVTVLSVLSSLAVGRLARATPLRFLFERPRWAVLGPARAPAPPAAADAAAG